MKNKALTYILTALVIAVWGSILYRVFGAFSGDNNDVAVMQDTKPKEAYNDYDIPKDTSHLQLNYRDPFGIAKPDTEEIPVGKLVHKQPAIQTAPPIQNTNWSFISYTGYIHNPGNKNLLAIVSINGKENMMKEGETNDQVKLLKNMKDSIKVSYFGKTKVIGINKTAP